MIIRKYAEIVENKLNHFSAVGLLGPRQIGKTTLAQYIASKRPAVYLDLENYQDLAKLEDPISYFQLQEGKLIILDEIHRKPDIFMILRSVIDQGRREGRKYGQFLILGSASLDLLKQSAESLAGRIHYIEMSPLNILEISQDQADYNALWVRGGFPESFLAPALDVSLEWRQSFIQTYLERDIPQFGPRISPQLLKRLWTMLAHCQGAPLNASALASSLDVSGQTISRYVDLLCDLFLLRRLQPWYENVGKRLVKSPKLYVRDSGILHALLHIGNFDQLLGHPILGQSYEGFAIDNILSFLSPHTQAYFYRTARGAEIDLVLEMPDGRRIAIEIKKSSAPKLRKGFYEGSIDIKATHKYLVYDGMETFSLGDGVQAIGLASLVNLLITN